MYSLQIDNINRDPVEKGRLLNAITEDPCIGNKATWIDNNRIIKLKNCRLKWVSLSAP